MKIVIALGGNALGNSPSEQKERVKKTAKTIIDLYEMGHQIVIGHGNGPQVGTIYLAFEEGSKHNDKLPEMPLVEAVAMSQGYIGYHIQQALSNELKERNQQTQVVTVLTQVEVAKDDQAFVNPTKPIGSFYTLQQVEAMDAWDRYIEDAGRGYRKVVASPKPLNIVELPAIKRLIDANCIVITVGGGGIPVVAEEDRYYGVEAVIDKDFSCAKLASDINADLLLILTAVDYVDLYHNTRDQKQLDHIEFSEIDTYIKEGHFAKGSMLPKIEACKYFLKQNPSAKAIITSLEKAPLALSQQVGTIIEYKTNENP